MQKNHRVSTSMQCFTSKTLCFAYASVSRTSKKKNCASHDCSASHHCRLVSNLFEIRHAKHLWFLHVKTQKTQTFLHTSHIPLLNWRRPETCKTKQLKLTVPPATHLSSRKTCIMQVKTKQGLFGLAVSRRHAKLMNMLRGPFVQHELLPKWLLPVLCYTHRLLSSSHHTSLHVSHIRTNQNAL